MTALFSWTLIVWGDFLKWFSPSEEGTGVNLLKQQDGTFRQDGKFTEFWTIWF